MGSPFGPYASAVEFLDEGTDGAQFEVTLEDQLDRGSLVGDDQELLVAAGIAERNHASNPDSLAF